MSKCYHNRCINEADPNSKAPGAGGPTGLFCKDCIPLWGMECSNCNPGDWHTGARVEFVERILARQDWDRLRRGAWFDQIPVYAKNKLDHIFGDRPESEITEVIIISRNEFERILKAKGSGIEKIHKIPKDKT